MSTSTDEGKIVVPTTLAGFRDTLPADMIPLQALIETVRRVYESFGFVPLDTPAMEKRDVLIGGGGKFNKSIFRASIVRGLEDENNEIEGEDDHMLRFDLTVPLARAYAQHAGTLLRPFRRYQIGKVWRGEKPQANRYREFTQFDADIVGAHSILADTEIIQLMIATLRTVGLTSFTVRINDRRILDGLAEFIGCEDRAKELFRVIDKIDEIGVEGVIAELMRVPESPLDTKLVLGSIEASIIRDFLGLASPHPYELLRRVENFFQGKSHLASEGTSALRELFENLDALGLHSDLWRFDLSIARGLDYYTGPVFETVINDMPKLGSVFSGGRFDGLVSRFITGSNVPGVGASIGVDRLLTALLEKRLLVARNTRSEVFIPVFGEALRKEALLLADSLRGQGINAELYVGDEPTMRAQIAYAVKLGIRFIAILGPDEQARGEVSLKDTLTKKQESLTLEAAIDRIRAARVN